MTDHALLPSRRVDRDALNMLPRDTVATDASRLIDPLKNEKGERLLAATAVAFAIMCERTSMSPQDMWLYGRRVLGADEPFHRQGNTQVEALRDFAGLRINSNPII